MNLLEMLAKPASTKPVGVIDRIISSLPGDESDRVREVLADRTFPASQIVAALASAGHTVSETTVRAYRRQMVANDA